MNILIREKAPNIEIRPVDVIIDGKVVGELSPRLHGEGDVITWHASLHLDQSSSSSSSMVGFFQRFGASHEAALEDVIHRARKEMIARSSMIEQFARSIGFIDRTEVQP